MIKTNKTKAHIRYTLKDGSIVPGVTTVLGILAKPALIPWANRLGLQGIDVNKYVDEKAEIGSLAHLMILAYLKGEKLDTSEYSQKVIDKAENCLISFFQWEKRNPFKVLLVEKSLVSEKWGYGGTLDLLAQWETDGNEALIDFKTSPAIYPDMIFQLAAYEQPLLENGYCPVTKHILRIGRDESEGFEERTLFDLSLHWEIFKNCLNIYNLKKKIKGG
jgi:hypothetical protein